MTRIYGMYRTLSLAMILVSPAQVRTLEGGLDLHVIALMNAMARNYSIMEIEIRLQGIREGQLRCMLSRTVRIYEGATDEVAQQQIEGK